MSWKKKQREELTYWQNTTPEVEEEWYRTYDPLLPLIGEFGFDLSVVDVGCGALPFSLRFPFKDVTLVDPLMREYEALPWSTVNQTKKHVPFPTEMVYYDPQPDAFFLFNCLDHMPHDAAVSTLRRATLARRYVAGYVDYRKKGDKYHYAWNTDLDKLLLPLRLRFTQNCVRPRSGLLFLYVREDGE